ncbi:MAG: GntG family PLP-dependent aldolase [Bacteroidota bacterium]
MMIDLRSDTVTKPSEGMRTAMSRALVGDDVFGEDPTVNRLQETMAELLGKEAALFTPTGVMANQIAIRCHTQPGDEVIVERDSHILNYETGAPALVSGVQLLPVPGVRGIPDVDGIEEAIRQDAYYLPRTSLICLENTHNRAGGTVFPLETMRRIRDVASRRQIRVHLDGARIWNAWVASGVHPRTYAGLADSISVCFSKGLGAPVGSLIAGTRSFIEHARKARKILGGGMRQAGILAAAALYAIEHNVERLKEDHANAKAFSSAVNETLKGRILCSDSETNIIIMDIGRSGKRPSEMLSLLTDAGVALTQAGPAALRAVTHMDVSRGDVLKAAELIGKALR